MNSAHSPSLTGLEMAIVTAKVLLSYIIFLRSSAQESCIFYCIASRLGIASAFLKMGHREARMHGFHG